MAVSDYSTTPSANTSIGGVNIAEGCAPANLNNAIRQMMADIKSYSLVTLATNTDVTVSATYTFTGTMDFNDGAVLRIGTDNDLTLRHTGTQSRISHDGTGDLQIGSNTNITLMNQAWGQTLANFAVGGAATLYHNNVAKIATAAAGAAVTGNVAVTADIVVSEAADHTTTPAAGKGIFWVKNDAPCVAKFTDDAGGDWTFETQERLNGLKFESTGQTITAAGSLTLAHGLGAAGRNGLMAIWIQCTSTDQGWAVGDRYRLSPGPSTYEASSPWGVSLWVDATNVNVIFGNETEVFLVHNKSTKDLGAIDPTKWEFYVKLVA